MPQDDQWQALDEKLERHAAAWILWEDEPLPEIASRLRERGVEGVVYSPSARLPDAGDLLSVMRDNVENLERVFVSSE